MFDAFYIYTYYRQRNGSLSQYITCIDHRDLLNTDIHGEKNFAPVEFAGAVTTVLFYVCTSD